MYIFGKIDYFKFELRKCFLGQIWLGIQNLFDKYVLYTGLGQTFNVSSQPVPPLFTHCGAWTRRWATGCGPGSSQDKVLGIDSCVNKRAGQAVESESRTAV